MGRAPCCEKMGLKKGPWTPEEDQILISFIQRHGHGNWRALPKQAGLLRCGKSCRLRWINYLRPDIKRGNFSEEEEGAIINLHQILGNRWSIIAARLPGRTDNEIKNYWHSRLKKRLDKQNFNTTTQESDDQTLTLQRDLNNATELMSKSETNQRIRNPGPEDTPMFQKQSQLELAGPVDKEGAADSSRNFSEIERKHEPRDFAAIETMNYDSSNVVEFWYNILKQAAGNSIEMQKSLGQFG